MKTYNKVRADLDSALCWLKEINVILGVEERICIAGNWIFSTSLNFVVSISDWLRNVSITSCIFANVYNNRQTKSSREATQK